MSIATAPLSTKGLAEEQLRGSACVSCATPLDNGTAVDLGPRKLRRLDTRVWWFPRACPGCSAEGGAS